MTDIDLVRYDAACVALASAKSVDEAKDILDKAVAMRAYAKQAKNRQLEIDAAEIRIRAERRVGELIAAQKQTEGLAQGGARKLRAGPDGTRSYRCLVCRCVYNDRDGHVCPEAKPTLAEAGIDKHLAHRARTLAALPLKKFEEHVDRWRDRTLKDAERVKVDVLAPTTHVSQNSGDNEWFTPTPYIEAARTVLGEIDLDPASTVDANAVVKATRFFTKDDDGLSQVWAGRVWMNPPYEYPLIEQFVVRLSEAFDRCDVTAAVVLVNNACETAWFEVLSKRASAICFPKGRVRFWAPGKPSAAPLQGQAVLYLGAVPAAFIEAFSVFGQVWVKP